MEYKDLKEMNSNDKNTLKVLFDGIINGLKHVPFTKVSSIVRYIPEICRLHRLSYENRKLKSQHPKKFHPVRPLRGEIFNATITEGIGSELSGNHLVIIMQNDKGNIYGEKVNVLPIEGDGNQINPNYQVKLTNEDLENGHLDKDPSRIIITDIMTIDKARLDRKIGTVCPTKMKFISTKLMHQLDLQKSD